MLNFIRIDFDFLFNIYKFVERSNTSCNRRNRMSSREFYPCSLEEIEKKISDPEWLKKHLKSLNYDEQWIVIHSPATVKRVTSADGHETLTDCKSEYDDFIKKRKGKTINEILEMETPDYIIRDQIRMESFLKKSFLHLAIAYPESLNVILKTLKEIGKLNEGLRIIDINKQTPLHLAIRNDESFKILLECYQNDDDKRNALKEKSETESNVLLHLNTENESLKIIFELYQEHPSDLLNLIKDKNKYNENFIHIAANHSNNHNLAEALSKFESVEQIELINTKNSEGFSVAHLAAQDLKCTILLLNLLESDEEKIKLLLSKNNDGKSVVCMLLKYKLFIPFLSELDSDDLKLKIIRHLKEERLNYLYSYHEVKRLLSAIKNEEFRLNVLCEIDKENIKNAFLFDIDNLYPLFSRTNEFRDIVSSLLHNNTHATFIKNKQMFFSESKNGNEKIIEDKKNEINLEDDRPCGSGGLWCKPTDKSQIC